MEAGDAAARDRLIEGNLRLVASVARWYENRSLDCLDLAQEGNIGLYRAAERFDWRKGAHAGGGREGVPCHPVAGAPAGIEGPAQAAPFLQAGKAAGVYLRRFTQNSFPLREW